MDAQRKTSRKRQAMLEALRQTKEHPTAEMLYNCLKGEYPELSLGTVYRNLSILVQDGEIVSVAHVRGQERYDARTEPHVHFVCRNCSRVMDLEISDDIKGMYEQVRKESGCQPESHSLTISGVCSGCAN